MKIRIPKDMRGIKNEQVLTIDINDFDIDLFLPSLFFKVIAGGAQVARRPNDPGDINKYIVQLSSHPDLVGFDTTNSLRLLGRLTRSAIAVMGRKGRGGGQGEQILALAPFSLLTYKAGFPKQGNRQRSVDNFLYAVLLSTARSGSRFEAEKTLRERFVDTFGNGVVFGGPPNFDGTYDGMSSLDTLTRLSIAFLDGLSATPAGKHGGRHLPSASCPSLATELGEDMLRYLNVYSSRIPAQSFTYNMQALINVELFTYTLKLAHAVNALVADPEYLPPAMRENVSVSPPSLYVDFTSGSGSLSQVMAVHCVRRDIEAYQKFLWSNLMLRQLHTYVEQLRRIPSRKARIDAVLDDATDGPYYLQRLLMLRNETDIGSLIEGRAMNDEDRIREEYILEDGEEDKEALLGLDEIAAGYESYLERVVALLVEGQRDNALDHYVNWFWAVGGLKKTHGILAGNTRSRLSWRYAPTNDLLAVLVQLAAIRQPARDTRDAYGNVIIQSIRLQDFLAFLEQRFGILVDRPPAPFSGAEATAAARENLGAMLRRLRQMGIFSDLSDDFTVQRLHPPYANVSPIRAEV